MTTPGKVLLLPLCGCLAVLRAPCQATPAPPAEASVSPAPLPEIHVLMLEVQARQRDAEAAQRDYTYRQLRVIHELDGKGEVKKTTTREFDVFWLNGVEISKLLSENGVPLTAEAKKKQSAQIDREVAAAQKRRAKADAKGEETDSHGRPTLQISQFLADGVFSNERRETRSGRDTILIDFTGDPKGKYPNPLYDMQGTLAIDEQEHALVGAKGNFIHNFTMLGGLLVKIDLGTTFAYETSRINDEVWLPASYHLEGEARILLLFSGHVRYDETDSDYRKFKTKSTILPGYTPVEPFSAPPDPK